MNISEIEKYITEIQDAEKTFRNSPDYINNKNGTGAIIRVIKSARFLLLASVDLIHLLYLLYFRKNIISNKRFVYTGIGSTVLIKGKLEDRIVKPFFKDDLIFINSQKSTHIKKINNQKVYNLGGLIKPLSILFKPKYSERMRIFKTYNALNDIIIRQLHGNEVYVICLWEMNTLSIVFSRYRSKIKLIKVQHGSMINYPPYVKPAPIKIADLFYVRNKPTIEFLKNHLCLDHPVEYKIIPYPEGKRLVVPGTHILYASTIETDGLHPVFCQFLNENKNPELHVIVRLHPREKGKAESFRSAIKKYLGIFEFDESKDWLESITIKNLIVVSPWSSALEEAFDNGFISITIDSVGKTRFSHFIDNKTFYYTDNLGTTIDKIKTSHLDLLN